MALFADILQYIAAVLLMFSGGLYLRQLEKNRRQRKLTTYEMTAYVVINVALMLFLIGLLTEIFFT